MKGIVFAVVAAVIAGAGSSDQRPSDGLPARTLEIDAVALDAQERPVEDLTAADIEVWIAGARVPVEALVAVDAAQQDSGGRAIAVILDDVTVQPGLVPLVKRAADRLLQRIVPEDRVAIIGLAAGFMKPTGDQDLLLRRLEQYNLRASGFVRPDDLGAQVLGTVADASRQLAEGPGRRKTIVAIGSASLFDRPIPPSVAGRDLQREWVQAMRAMAHGHANLYVIDPGGVGMALPTGGDTGFAREAGGHAFTNTNDLAGAVDRILREASRYHVITVTDPPIHRKAPLRELDVRSRRPGVTVRARRGVPGWS